MKEIKVKVLIIDKINENVKVVTEIGVFYGVWCSADAMVGKEYIVELDSDEIIDNVVLSNDNSPSVNRRGETIMLTALLESVQDNLMFLRLQESLVMIEHIPGLELAEYIGKMITIKLEKVQLYDIKGL